MEHETAKPKEEDAETRRHGDPPIARLRWWASSHSAHASAVHYCHPLGSCAGLRFGLPQGAANRLRAAERTRRHGKRQRHGRLRRDVRSGRASRVVLGFALAAAGSGRLRRLVPRRLPAAQPGVVNWFERWLRAKPNRTLIYVGRDFDAAPWYWRKIEPTAPAGQQEAIADVRGGSGTCLSVGPAARTAHGDMPLVHGPLWRGGRPGEQRHRRPRVVAEHRSVAIGNRIEQPDVAPVGHGRLAGVRRGPDSSGGSISGRANSWWFPTVRSSSMRRWSTTSTANWPESWSTPSAPAGATSFSWKAARSRSISRPARRSPAPTPFGRSPERRLSRRHASRQDADNGPPIRRTDPAPDMPNGLELLLVWPTNWILLHFVLIGILFCFWKLPIFGLPRPEDPIGAADFGRHIDAVAALLQRTADRRYALSRVKHYQQIVKKVE